MTEKDTPLRVLFAEDDAALRTIMKNVLAEDLGYNVTACGTGDEAVQHLKQQEFDIVLLDYMMPGMSGLNVLQWMHEQKIETPVIMLTGAGTEIVAVEAMKLGAYDYIRKENVEIEHLPVILRGVRERFEFKKERERQQIRELYSTEVVRRFNETTVSAGEIATRSLREMTENIAKYESTLSSYIREDGVKPFADTCEMLKQNCSVISFAVNSFLSSVDMLSTELFKPDDAQAAPPTSPAKKDMAGVS